jgi:predicted CXXCH cytochrome family protein
MKKTSFKVVGGLALLAASSMAMASVINTKHNLGASHPTGVDGNHTNATTEICIFCHTPHGADQNTFAPLWNRATGTATYQRFSDLGRLTFDAAEAPIGSVSAACLSCHDGTQGMDSVINSPHSDTTGNVSSEKDGLAAITGGTGGFSQSNIMSDGFSPADGHWDGGATRGDMVYLGTDLRNDHPISMQYGGGGLSSASPTGATTDPDFAQNATNSKTPLAVGAPGGLWDSTTNAPKAVPAKSNALSTNTTGGVDGSGTGLIMHDNSGNAAQSGSTDRWWVSSTNNALYSSEDFPLYTRNDVANKNGITNLGVAQPTVECGTCHDPHSGNPTFLRLPGGNAGSQVCLTCHAK